VTDSQKVSDVAEGILYLERATFETGEILHLDAVTPLDTDSSHLWEAKSHALGS
jgi:hypothetical protein